MAFELCCRVAVFRFKIYEVEPRFDRKSCMYSVAHGKDHLCPICLSKVLYHFLNPLVLDIKRRQFLHAFYILSKAGIAKNLT